MDEKNPDFCITIDFEKKSDNPARVFQTMTSLIQAFQNFDQNLLQGMDTKLEPVILLEDVEVGSLKTWLSELIKGIPDEAIKELSWKKLLGNYLVKAKWIVINKLENKTEITDARIIEEIQYEIVEEARKTDVKSFPHYEPMAIPKLITNIDEINKSLVLLNENDTATFQSHITDDASFNLKLSFTPDKIEELMTKERLNSTSTMILKVKKPDYLGTSMWEFKHNNRSLPAKILDESWLIRFQKRQVDIRPGDSIKVKMSTTVKYGHDNNVIGVQYEILEVMEVLPLNNVSNLELF